MNSSDNLTFRQSTIASIFFRTFSIFLVLTTNTICLGDQNNHYGNMPLRFKAIDIPELNSLGFIGTISQDAQGFIWFGGTSGLARYDGYEVKIYRNAPNSPNSLSHNKVIAILADSKDRLWVATQGGGLNLFDPVNDGFTRYQHSPDNPHSLSSNRISSIFESTDGTIWVSTWDKGLNLFDPISEKSTHYTSFRDNDKIHTFKNLSCVYEDNKGILWLGTRAGELFQFSPPNKTGKQYNYKEVLSTAPTNNHISLIYEDQRQQLWVGTEGGGISQVDRTTNTFIHYKHDPYDSNSIGSNVVVDATEDLDGNLWIATEGNGINVFNNKDNSFSRYPHHYSIPGSPLTNKVRSLYRDSVGDIWLGHFPHGVSRLDRYSSTFTNYTHDPYNDNSLSNNEILAFSEDRHKNLWVGTEGGLNYFNRQTGSFTRYIHNPKTIDSLPAPAALTLLEDSTGNLWVGTFGGGLSRLNRKTGKFSHHQSNSKITGALSDNRIWTLYEDKQNKIWVGTMAGGLNLYDPNTEQFTIYNGGTNNISSITPGYVHAIYEDSKNNFWIGTTGGLNLMDRKKGSFTRFQYDKNSPHSISANRVRSIFEDSNGNLWIGTLGGGLNRFDKQSKTFTSFRVKDGLPNNSVTGILEDQQGYLWLSTEQGLSRFNPRTEKFRNYNRQHGLPGNIFTTPANIKTSQGELVFGSTEGFTIFNPLNIFEDTHTPSVIITNFQLFNKEVVIESPKAPFKGTINTTSEINLRHDQSVFSFTFSALNYRLPSMNQYAYRLTGFDKDWSYVGNTRTATYTNLDPGEYTFQVKAANSEGVWNEEGTSLHIKVLPPWWHTWWAYLSYISVIGVIIGIYIYQHIQRQKALLLAKENALLAKDNALLAQQNAESASHAKSVFIANVSHEIRTPLNAVLGYSQLLERDPGTNQEQRKKLGIIERSGSHLLGLINDILDISKIEAGGMELHEEEFDLIALITGIAEMFQIRCAEKQLEWALENKGIEQRHVYGDQGKLRQVLINLLGNAIKFTDKGKVSLALSTYSKDQYTFSVKDTGLGISPEYQSEVFKPFGQTEDGLKRGGTGLGLAITSEQILLMGGKLELCSQLGKGSTFSFHLKLPQAHGTVEIRKDRHKQVSHLSTGTRVFALVVDDVKENRELLAQMLKQIGVDVALASNGREALDYLKQHKDNIFPDLVFMDIRMPIMDGIEALRQIQDSFGKEIPQVVVITAHAMHHEIESYLQAGFNHYIAKPFRFEAIYECIHNLLDVNFEYAQQETRGKQTSNNDSNSPILPKIKLAPELYQMLKRAINDSEIAKIEEAIEVMKKLGPDEKSVAKHFAHYLNQYDFDGLLASLDELSINE